MFKEYFDDFELKARIFPAITVALPILIVAFVNGWLNKSITEFSGYALLTVIMIAFFSKVARNMGKAEEQKLYIRLGEKPTTIVMRYSDKRINALNKTRYHKRLNQLFEDLQLPIFADQETKESDIYYDAAMTLVRNYANSNRNKEERVYQELKDYNYWRNLYGCKKVSLVIYAVGLTLEIYRTTGFSIEHITVNSLEVLLGAFIFVVSIVLMCIFVTKATVEEKAFDYAVTLVEVCERI